MKKNNILKTFDLYDFNKIKNLLKMLNIDDKFDYIQYLNLEKIIIYFYKLNYVLKISNSNHSIRLSVNEKIGYDNSNLLSKFINIPLYKCIHNDENLFVSKIKYLGNKKGNYFQLNDFYKFNKNIPLKKSIKSNEYIERLNLKYLSRNNLSEIKEIKNFSNYFIRKFGNENLPTNVSHGDLVHWNTLAYNKVNYLYDLEHFDLSRIVYYDIIHWYVAPFFMTLYKLKITFTYKVLFRHLLNLLKRKLTKSFFLNLDQKFLNQIIFLYFFEKKLFYYQLFSENNTTFHMTKDYYLRSLNQITLINMSLDLLLKNKNE